MIIYLQFFKYSFYWKPCKCFEVTDIEKKRNTIPNIYKKETAEEYGLLQLNTKSIN